MLGSWENIEILILDGSQYDSFAFKRLMPESKFEWPANLDKIQFFDYSLFLNFKFISIPRVRAMPGEHRVQVAAFIKILSNKM